MSKRNFIIKDVDFEDIEILRHYLKYLKHHIHQEAYKTVNKFSKRELKRDYESMKFWLNEINNPEKL